MYAVPFPTCREVPAWAHERVRFETADNRPVPAVTAAEMAGVDRAATDEIGLHSL